VPRRRSPDGRAGKVEGVLSPPLRGLVLRLGRRRASQGLPGPDPARGEPRPSPLDPAPSWWTTVPHPPARFNGGRGGVGGTSWPARPPARRCAVAAGGLVPSGWGSGGV
jgi:hypothetical protein